VPDSVSVVEEFYPIEIGLKARPVRNID
jgi:hypothetical protein